MIALIDCRRKVVIHADVVAPRGYWITVVFAPSLCLRYGSYATGVVGGMCDR